MLRTRFTCRLPAFLSAFSVGLLVSGTLALADPTPNNAPSADEAAVASPSKPQALALPPMELPGNGSSVRRSGGTSYADIVAIIDREAKRTGMPAEVAEAVTHTESAFNPSVIGNDGEIGLMQVMPSTARMMGFSGSLSDLAVPEINIRYGVSYLAQAWRLAGGDLCTAVMKYRAGHGESRFSYLSVDYCLKVRKRLTARGFVVTGVVPPATFGNQVAGGGGGGSVGRCRNKCLFGSKGGPNLAALNSKLSQIAFHVTVLKVPMR